MAAPIGKTFTGCAQLGMRVLRVNGSRTPRNFLTCFATKYCINQMSFYPYSVKKDFNFAPLLCLTGAQHKKYRLLNQPSRNLSAATSVTNEEVRKEIDAITDKFMEAKEYLDDAKDSMDSVYFDEDMKDAEDAIQETLNMYQDLIGRLNEEQKQNVTRTIGLKMEELKAQLDMIKESLRE
ncbi:uncharacterized protein [Amphiura filiformis]|uniref:uncharacterized protein n=1 Tax=Amphiura filiformis TaxID=82378 RepID=UPI003B21B381